ncbi:MAG: methyltransferase domain-containing protein [bacterium]|nr:methyltransferase domain-containing protein [bacterium]
MRETSWGNAASPVMSLDTIGQAVRGILAEFPLVPPPRFLDLLKKEWSVVPTVDLSAATIREEDMNRLYELRAKLLDWTVETGFLGFFDKNPGRRYIYTRRLEILQEMLPELAGIRVLEVGCAAGIVAALLAPQCQEYVGVDVTETAIRFARQLHRELNIFNSRFVVGDGQQLPFPDRSFDAIVTTETFEHFLDPGKALAEFHRVLKPEGILIMTTTTAVTLSDGVVRLIRVFKSDLYVDTEEQFDKKTYLAAQERGLPIQPKIFRRVHRRFGYGNLVRLFQRQGFVMQDAKGAVFAFPPIYLGVYQFLPKAFLPMVRWGEELLNELGIFKRFGSVTTGFRLQRR